MNIKISNLQCKDHTGFENIIRNREIPSYILLNIDYESVGKKIIKLFEEGMSKATISEVKEIIE